ncbi:hypothetical protein D2E80_09185 [Mycobacteroides abscessus]|nr:hypothetical protein D2E80_09185 [Mycobacteroides abscessus]
MLELLRSLWERRSPGWSIAISRLTAIFSAAELRLHGWSMSAEPVPQFEQAFEYISIYHGFCIY